MKSKSLYLFLCLALKIHLTHAQDTLQRFHNIYFGYQLSDEFYYYMEESDKDGERISPEKNYQFSSKVYYAKYIQNFNSSRTEIGATVAVSIGEITNEVQRSDYVIDYTWYHAQRDRYAVSLLFRYNYLFVNKKYLNIYGGAGFGLRVSKYINYNDDCPCRTDDDLSRVFFPFSSELVAGIRLYPYKHFGFYAEGGAAKTLFQGGILFRW